MIATFVWDGNLQTTMTHSSMWSTQMRHTAFGAFGEIFTPEKEGWSGLDICDGRP